MKSALSVLLLGLLLVSCGEKKTPKERVLSGDAEALDEFIRKRIGAPTESGLLEAVEVFNKAAERGYPVPASDKLIIYRLLAGNHAWGNYRFEKNLAKSAKWYLEAAKLEDDECQCKIAEIYYTGKGVPQDKAEGVKWYRRAAQQGNESAKQWLKQYFEHQLIEGWPTFADLPWESSVSKVKSTLNQKGYKFLSETLSEVTPEWREYPQVLSLEFSKEFFREKAAVTCNFIEGKLMSVKVTFLHLKTFEVMGLIQKMSEMLVKKYGNPTHKTFSLMGGQSDKLTEKEALKLASKDPSNVRDLFIHQFWMGKQNKMPLVLKFSKVSGLSIAYTSEQSISVYRKSHYLKRIREKKEEEERKAKAAEDF